MPRRESRGHRLPTGGYREHRLAIWGVTGCVAVAAGVALTAGLAAASPHLGNIPDSTDNRPALAGLPTTHPTPDVDPTAEPLGASPAARIAHPAGTPTPTAPSAPTADPSGDQRSGPSGDASAGPSASGRSSSPSRPRSTQPWRR